MVSPHVYVCGSRLRGAAMSPGYRYLGTVLVTYVSEKITMVSFRQPGYLLR